LYTGEILKDISPDFACYLVEFPFGDIYSRTGLDLKSREIATTAGLAAMGNAFPQLLLCFNYRIFQFEYKQTSKKV